MADSASNSAELEELGLTASLLVARKRTVELPVAVRSFASLQPLFIKQTVMAVHFIA